jgi:hypothetical protein
MVMYLLEKDFNNVFKTCLKRQQKLTQETAENEKKSPAGTRQTDGKNLAWLEEIERKLAKLLRTTFIYRSSSYLF